MNSKGIIRYDPANIPVIIPYGKIHNMKDANANDACAIYLTNPPLFFARPITPVVFRILYSTLAGNSNLESLAVTISISL